MQESEKTIALDSVFLQYFTASDHAFCIYDIKNKEVIKKNPAFLEAEESLCLQNGRKLELNSEGLIHEKIKQTYISEDILLLECDELINDHHSNTSYLRLKEENLHANIQAKELSEKLQQAEDQFHKLAKITPTGMLLTNTDFQIVWSNNKAYELFGTKNIKKQNLLDLIYVNDIKIFYKNIKNLTDKNNPINLTFSV